MNGLLIGVKRFFKNKNTVMIFAVVASLAILYFAYNARIKKATEPQSIPYAIDKIEPRTKITSEMIGTRKVPGSVITSNVSPPISVFPAFVLILTVTFGGSSYMS